MILQEPKIEFVSLELSKISTVGTNICNTGTTSGGGQYCYNSQTDAEECPDNVVTTVWDTTLPEECQSDNVTM